MNEGLDADLEFDGEFEEDDELPCSNFILSFLSMPKPFGFIFDDESIEKFLKKRGYRIVTRQGADKREIKIVIKQDDSCIPELDTSNMRSVFYNEVQEIVLNWLLKIGGEN